LAPFTLPHATRRSASKLHATGHTKTPNLFWGPAGYYLATMTFKGQFWRKKKRITYNCRMLSGCCWRPRAPCQFLQPTGLRTAEVARVALVEGVAAKKLVQLNSQGGIYHYTLANFSMLIRFVFRAGAITIISTGIAIHMSQNKN
jgi:hypothetical protein